eukprot:c7122_g1_i1.p1 GENE.c7122_g1_i1~~c7122_g1_i1.p1  ORF type:complete len:417 (-),score=155.92 c7122_g1_i1:17-1198(-)
MASSGNNVTFWLVSAPAQNGVMFSTLNDATSTLSQNVCLTLPKLKAGTLDSLMTLSDDLVKQDQQIEGILRKLERQMGDLGIQTFSIQVDRKNLTPQEYVMEFKWASNRYQDKLPLTEITGKIHQEVMKVDEDLRAKQSDYNHIKSQVQAHTRKQGGNLAVRSLASLGLNRSDFIDTENFMTVVVVVPKMDEKQWVSSYQKGLLEKPANLQFYPVLFNSSKKVFEDEEAGLWTCTILKRMMNDFKTAIREKEPRWTVREFQYDEVAIEEEKKQLSDTTAHEEKARKQLVLWCKAMHGEVFRAFVHLKVIRVFVESCLRFGVPPDFQPVVMKLHNIRDEKKVRKLLAKQFDRLASAAMFGGSDEALPSVVGGQEFYPYVFLPLTVAESKVDEAK